MRIPLEVIGGGQEQDRTALYPTVDQPDLILSRDAVQAEVTKRDLPHADSHTDAPAIQRGTAAVASGEIRTRYQFAPRCGRTWGWSAPPSSAA